MAITSGSAPLVGADRDVPVTPHLQGRHVLVARLPGRALLGVRRALALAGAVVLDVPDLESARRRAALLGPRAAVLTDLWQATDAWQALRALRLQDAVLVMSDSCTPQERLDLLRAGADHVLSGEHPDEVLACLAAVLRRAPAGPTSMVTEVLRVGPLSAHLTARTATVDGRFLALTGLEFDLLAYFLAHPGQPLSRERLLAEVWGYALGGLDTVTVHVRRLRVKLERDPAHPVHLVTVYGRGYRLATSPEAALPAAPLAGRQLGGAAR